MSTTDELAIVLGRLRAASERAVGAANDVPYETLVTLISETAWCTGYLEKLAEHMARDEQAARNALTRGGEAAQR